MTNGLSCKTESLNKANGGAYSVWLEDWQKTAKTGCELQLFALLDVAQDRSLISRVADAELPNECLYGYAIDTPIAEATPRLVLIDPVRNENLLSRVVEQLPKRPLATLIAAPCNLSSLAAHLRKAIDVQLEGQESMFLALWDPAILGTLLGINTDKTLHVPGPVLLRAQSRALIGPIDHWWYWDRDGKMHDAAISVVDHDSEPEDFPLKLSQAQVEMLVEASVPDHLIYHLSTNLPELLERLLAKKRYDFVRQQLGRAREYGLRGTGDLLNYVSIALAFGATFDELPAAKEILRKVQRSELSFGQAMKVLPEKEMEQSAHAPDLL